MNSFKFLFVKYNFVGYYEFLYKEFIKILWFCCCGLIYGFMGRVLINKYEEVLVIMKLMIILKIEEMFLSKLRE